MERGCSFIELAHMHLVLKEYCGNATHDVKQCREKCPNSRVPHHYAFLSVDRRLQERGNFIECDGMLAVYIPCIIYRWKTTDP
jgi:hypothetical protein